MKPQEAMKQDILKSVLTSITKAVMYDLDEDLALIEKNDVEITHDGEIIATAKIRVRHNVYSKSFSGDADTPPHGFESDLFLEFAQLEMIYDDEGNQKPYLTLQINVLLEAMENYKL